MMAYRVVGMKPGPTAGTIKFTPDCPFEAFESKKDAIAFAQTITEYAQVDVRRGTKLIARWIRGESVPV